MESTLDVHKSESTNKDSPFYVDGAQYWEKVDPTIDGMLGGYAQISDVDLQGSQRFLNSIYQVISDIHISLQNLMQIFMILALGEATKEPSYWLWSRYRPDHSRLPHEEFPCSRPCGAEQNIFGWSQENLGSYKTQRRILPLWYCVISCPIF